MHWRICMYTFSRCLFDVYHIEINIRLCSCVFKHVYSSYKHQSLILRLGTLFHPSTLENRHDTTRHDNISPSINPQSKKKKKLLHDTTFICDYTRKESFVKLWNCVILDIDKKKEKRSRTHTFLRTPKNYKALSIEQTQISIDFTVSVKSAYSIKFAYLLP